MKSQKRTQEFTIVTTNSKTLRVVKQIKHNSNVGDAKCWLPTTVLPSESVAQPSVDAPSLSMPWYDSDSEIMANDPHHVMELGHSPSNHPDSMLCVSIPTTLFTPFPGMAADRISIAEGDLETHVSGAWDEASASHKGHEPGEQYSKSL